MPAVDQGHNLKNFNGFPNSTKICATAILSAKGCKLAASRNKRTLEEADDEGGDDREEDRPKKKGRFS